MALNFNGAGSSGTALATAQASRNEQHQTLSFANDVYAAAQARGSMLMPAVKKVELSGSKQMFDVEQPVDYKIRVGGISKTVFDKQVTSRREMQSRQWHASVAVSRIDEYSSSLDLKMAFKRQLINGQGRLLDFVILNAIVEPAVLENKATAAVYDRTAKDELKNKISDVIGPGTLHYQSTVKVQEKTNLYANFTSAGAVDDFDVDTITDLRHLFRLRNQTGTPVATLTPEIERVLMKESDFKSSERVFKIGGSIDSLTEAINYRGINWVRVQPEVLPDLSIDNIGYGGTGTEATGTVQYLCRSLNAAAPRSEPRLVDRPDARRGVAAASSIRVGSFGLTVAGGNRDTFSAHACYIWMPRSLYCSTSGVSHMKEGDLQAFREDPYIYSTIPASAMLIEESAAIVYLSKGFTATVAIGSATSGVIG